LGAVEGILETGPLKMLSWKIFAVGSWLGFALFAETHQVSPDRYYTTFSAAHQPVARVRPGDTVVTKCLDSRGRNETGKLQTKTSTMAHQFGRNCDK
jgi:hypothetical protein